MAREDEKKRQSAANGARQSRRTSMAGVSADDIRRLVAKLKEEEPKK
ncbi:MAG TPA: hypothetical protein VE553_00680 [Candidatus Binatia bacterium]|jgi:hypothetical protein|nr:hypothetical protein [Candidatus Binatia bacterium]